MVLIVAVVSLTLVLTVAAMATTHLTLSNKVSNSIRARQAADSLIQTVIAHLLEEPQFGHPSHPSFTSDAALMQLEGHQTRAQLAFDPAQAAANDIPVSLNNVDTDAPAQGIDRVIPSESLQLWAVGECGGVKKTVEVVVHIPRFPYVVCTSGPFESRGPLVVGTLPETLDADTVESGDLLPGHLASNSDRSDAVSLRDEAVVAGDVESVGGISAPASVVIQGSRLANSEPVEIPDLRIEDYDTEFRPGVEVFTGSSSNTTLAGYNRSTTHTTVEGDLTLEAGVLYVAGDLTVRGDINGRGAIFTEGNILVQNSTDIVGDQQIALVAGGDVVLNGGGRFRGVVYTEGNFTSSGVGLVGAFVNNAGSGGGRVAITDAGIVAGDSTLSFRDNWLARETSFGGLDFGAPDVFGPHRRGDWRTYYPADFPTWRQTSEFVGIEGGLVVVEWTTHGYFPAANGIYGEVYPRREYYDPATGDCVRVSFEGPGGLAGEGATTNGLTGPIPGSQAWFSEYDHDPNVWDNGGLDGGYLRLSQADSPGYANPQRVVVYEEVADFRFDISQFFSLEDRMKVLLWTEH